MPDLPTPQLLTVPEAAAFLKLSRSRVYEMITGPTPELRSVKIGKARRIPLETLQSYIAEHSTQQGD